MPELISESSGHKNQTKLSPADPTIWISTWLTLIQPFGLVYYCFGIFGNANDVEQQIQNFVVFSFPCLFNYRQLDLFVYFFTEFFNMAIFCGFRCWSIFIRGMGETGKRFRSQRDQDGDNKVQKRRGNEKDEKGSDELIVYRILCPDGVIGSVIGKSGKVINSIRQDTRAKIKVVDPFPGAKDRVITIYCYVKEKDEVEVDDEFNDKQPLCPAQDALLKVHTAIVNAIASVENSEKKRKDKEECQILVPSSQSANIIGKAGATIKRLRSKTRANIKITAKDAADPTHSCAMEFDNFVLVSNYPPVLDNLCLKQKLSLL